MKMIDDLISIAICAGEKIMSVYDSPQETIKVDNSPLTVADSLSNEYICNQLQSLFPEIPIISEENKEISYDVRCKYEKFWLVDPLDGTKEFIKRNGEFTVNIALIENGYSVAGVIYCPSNKETYFGTHSKGSYKIDNGGKRSELKCNAFNLKDSGLRFVCSRSHNSGETDEYLSKFLNPQVTNSGSSLKFMLLAEDKADIYPRLAPTMEWDTAAAQIILEEAGGHLIDQKTGMRMRYNKVSLLNNFFIAYANVDTF
jgi:3'(2'), 5'-bisphosphate nucleotidase